LYETFIDNDPSERRVVDREDTIYGSLGWLNDQPAESSESEAMMKVVVCAHEDGQAPLGMHVPAML